MTNFLTAEFNKILKRKNFYMSLAFVILASVLNIVIFLVAEPQYNSVSNLELQGVLMRFISNKFITIIIVFITTVFIAGANGNIIRNAISIGYTRNEVYASKLIIGSLVLLMLLFASMVSSFAFAGIWLYDVFTMTALWEAMIRYAMLALVYITLFAIALTLLYIINNSMVFAIVYFILFLVLTEIVETVSTLSPATTFFVNITLTHQLDQLINVAYPFPMWPYILGCSLVYSTATIGLGSLVINKKDI